MIRALLFDLDDTLYSEREYVASGFRVVAEYLGILRGCPVGEVFDLMMVVLDREGRRAVFPAVIERFLGPSFPIEELVAVYRKHDPGIRLFEGYEELLRQFHESFQLGVITDGEPEVQRRKCGALGLEDLVDAIHFTWQSGPAKEKPHPDPFYRMLNHLGRQAAEALFIGDNFEKDCCGAQGVGMRSVLIRGPRTSSSEVAKQAGFVIESLFQLPTILKQLED